MRRASAAQCYGLVAPLYEMARVAGRAARRRRRTRLHPARDTPTKLKVTGIDLFSAGDFAEGDDREEIVLRDAARGVYKRLVLQGQPHHRRGALRRYRRRRLVLRPAEEAATDIARDARHADLRPGLSREAPPLDPMAAVAALPDDAEICGCNGVCKGKITGAIAGKGLTTLDDVRAHTKASASCGSCTGLVEQLLTLDARRRLQSGRRPADVRLHRPRP